MLKRAQGRVCRCTNIIRRWRVAKACGWISTRIPKAARPAYWSEFAQITAEELARYPEREPVEKIVAIHLGLHARTSAANQRSG